MANMIVQNEISGASVYGVPQMSYTVNGVPDNDYAAALTAAAFRQSTAIEKAASSYMAVVRQRQQKVTDLGDVLSTLATAMASVEKSKNGPAPSDPCATSWQMDRAFDKVLRNYMTRGDIMRAQDNIQYALDVEDNNLQQDMVSLQGFVSKRDSAFSTASKIVSKSHNAADATISNI